MSWRFAPTPNNGIDGDRVPFLLGSPPTSFDWSDQPRAEGRPPCSKHESKGVKSGPRSILGRVRPNKPQSSRPFRLVIREYEQHLFMETDRATENKTVRRFVYADILEL
jgi:hypothetical protein